MKVTIYGWSTSALIGRGGSSPPSDTPLEQPTRSNPPLGALPRGGCLIQNLNQTLIRPSGDARRVRRDAEKLSGLRKVPVDSPLTDTTRGARVRSPRLAWSPALSWSSSGQ